MNVVQWIFPNFIKSLENMKEMSELRFENTAPQKPDDTTFSFRIKFTSRHNKNCDMFFSTSNFVKIKFRVCILIGHGQERCVLDINLSWKMRPNMWKYVYSINNESFAKNIRSDGSFIINLYYAYDVNKEEHAPELGCDEQINCELKALTCNGLFSNIVVIKSIEGNEYKVHKELLTSKSSVLKAHFEHNTTDRSQTNIIESPLEDEVLKEVMIYIYFDKTPSLKNIPEKLLAAADYYQLDQLKSLSEIVLRDKLCVGNAVDTLILADLHSATTLKRATLEFMKEEGALIIKSKGWAKLKSPELLKSFCTIILGDIKMLS